MLKKYRVIFYTVVFALAAFLFAPLTASAAPSCPSLMPDKWCDSLSNRCDRGNRRACTALERQQRKEDSIQSACDRGNRGACNYLKRLSNRKQRMDARNRPRMVAPECPELLPKSFCSRFTSQCERGSRGACSQINSQKRRIDQISKACDRGSKGACGALERLWDRKVSYDGGENPIKQARLAREAKEAARVAEEEKVRQAELDAYSGKVESCTSGDDPVACLTDYCPTAPESMQGDCNTQLGDAEEKVRQAALDAHPGLVESCTSGDDPVACLTDYCPTAPKSMQEDCNTQLGEATQVAVEEAVGEAEEANRVATEKADEARTKAEAARKAAETADKNRSSYEYHRTAHLAWKNQLTGDAEDANNKAGDADTAAGDADTAAETAAGLNKKIVPAEVVAAATIAYGDATAAAKEARAAAEQARIAADKATTAAGEAQAALDAPAEIVLPFCQGNGRAGTGIPPNCRDWANDKVTMSTKWPSMALGSCASPQGEDVQRCNHMAVAGEIPDRQTTANVSCPAFMSKFYGNDYVRYKCRYQPGSRVVWIPSL